MAPSAEQGQHEWPDRIGPAAAALRTEWYRWLLRAGLATLIFFALVIVAQLTHTRSVALLAVVPAVAWGICMAKGYQAMRGMRSAICSALGLAPGTKQCEPPRGRDAYRRWCDDKGLEPYPFRSPVPVAGGAPVSAPASPVPASPAAPGEPNAPSEPDTGPAQSG